MDEAKEILSRVFGYHSFRPGQEEAVSALLTGRDLLAVMPTGAGKSICYQVPALVRGHVTLVISPLISLMKDQVSALRQNGVRAAFINSTLTPSQQHKALLNAREGVYRIIYVAPERLMTDAFLSFACEAELDFVIVDEAHCVSQWGQDFRPAYLSVAPFLNALSVRPPVGAFTATATNTVRDDIGRLIGLRDPVQVLTGFDRPNLFFEVQRPDDRDRALLSFVSGRREESGIVYCATRKAAEQVASMLCANGIDAGCYHAGMGDEERARIQECFVSDRLPVIVATNAFGMGIDKSNVSFVVHYQMPKDLESYYQEAGRAGRDGSEAHCLLLYKPQDVRLQRFFLDKQEEESELNPETRKTVRLHAEARLREMTFYATGSGCLRERILKYFGESAGPCGHCGNCLAADSGILTGRVFADVSDAARQAVSLVASLNGRYGEQMISDVLKGKDLPSIRQRNLHLHSLYGSLGWMARSDIHALLKELLAIGALAVSAGPYPTLRTGERAQDVLNRAEVRLALSDRSAKKLVKAVEPGLRLDGTRPQTADRGERLLYIRLSELRKRVAKEQKAPPFIIFSNVTLQDMAKKRPHTREEMLRVTGVGEGKMQRYGAAFLREIRDWEEEQH